MSGTTIIAQIFVPLKPPRFTSSQNGTLYFHIFHILYWVNSSAITDTSMFVQWNIHHVSVFKVSKLNNSIAYLYDSLN